MGTSKSSSGSPGGAPMVPPWTPDPVAPGSAEPADNGSNPDGDTPPSQPPAPPPSPLLPIPIAPPARFAAARRSLGKFAGGSGGAGDMRRGIGHYTHKGLGGAATAARRMGGAATTAGSLYSSLSDLAAGSTTANGQIDPSVLQGRTANQIAAAIVEAIRPTDGTLDGDASRDAIQDSFAQLLTEFPEANLLDLTDDQRWLIVEGYLATDIFNRIELDIGTAIQDKAPTAIVAMQRLKEVKSYVRETVAAQLRKLHAKGETVTKTRANQIIRATIRQAFDVFESYAT